MTAPQIQRELKKCQTIASDFAAQLFRAGRNKEANALYAHMTSWLTGPTGKPIGTEDKSDPLSQQINVAISRYNALATELNSRKKDTGTKMVYESLQTDARYPKWKAAQLNEESVAQSFDYAARQTNKRNAAWMTESVDAISTKIQTLTKELEMREKAAPNLKGIPARQNQSAIDGLYDKLNHLHIQRLENKSSLHEQVSGPFTVEVSQGHMGQKLTSAMYYPRTWDELVKVYVMARKQHSRCDIKTKDGAWLKSVELEQLMTHVPASLWDQAEIIELCNAITQKWGAGLSFDTCMYEGGKDVYYFTAGTTSGNDRKGFSREQIVNGSVENWGHWRQKMQTESKIFKPTKTLRAIGLSESSSAVIEVWHNENPRFRNEKPTAFPKGFTHVANVHTDNLEHAYRQTNHIDQAWWENEDVDPIVKETRSTSVGDVLVKNGVKYLVSNAGMTKLQETVTHPSFNVRNGVPFGRSSETQVPYPERTAIRHGSGMGGDVFIKSFPHAKQC